jgi:hypothetical protein
LCLEIPEAVREVGRLTDINAVNINETETVEVGCEVCLSLLKMLYQQNLEQVRKPRATRRDEPTRAADCTISGCGVIQI